MDQRFLYRVSNSQMDNYVRNWRSPSPRPKDKYDPFQPLEETYIERDSRPEYGQGHFGGESRSGVRDDYRSGSREKFRTNSRSEYRSNSKEKFRKHDRLDGDFFEDSRALHEGYKGGSHDNRYEPNRMQKKEHDNLALETNKRVEHIEKLIEVLVQSENERKEAERLPVIGNRSKPYIPTTVWLSKIQDEGLSLNWSDEELINCMLSKMSDLMRAWFSYLPPKNFTWSEWKVYIAKAFPDHLDYSDTLRKIVYYTKKTTETIADYYFKKLYLLECCNIYGRDAVSCLIDGLGDPVIQAKAKSFLCSTPGELFDKFLVKLPDNFNVTQPNMFNMPYEVPIPVTNYQQFNNDVQVQSEIIPKVQSVAPMSIPAPLPKFTSPTVFRPNQATLVPGKKFRIKRKKKPIVAESSAPKFELPCPLCCRMGHVPRNCPKKLKCSRCKKRGHVTQNCSRVLVRCINTSNMLDRDYFKLCRINGSLRTFKSLVDTGCSEVLIKQNIAQELGISIKPSSKKITVYGGKTYDTIGEATIKLEVDEAVVILTALIVSDKIQVDPVVLGQSFINRDDVVMVALSGSVHFFDKDSIHAAVKKVSAI